MIMRCGRQGWSPRRPNLICHNPSVTAIVSRVRVLLAHQGMSLPDALAQRMYDFRCGSKCEELSLSICRPVYP